MHPPLCTSPARNEKTAWRSHDVTALKLHVAETYVSNHAVDDIKDELKSMRDVIYRMALKLEVPVFTEPYRG